MADLWFELKENREYLSTSLGGSTSENVWIGWNPLGKIGGANTYGNRS